MFFNFFHVFSVQVFKLLTLILPFINFSIFCFFSPLYFVIIHVLLKPLLPPGHKINFSNNIIRNATQIKKHHDKVRLFTSLSNLIRLHVSIIVQFVLMAIFNQMLSIIGESSDIIKISTVLWITKNVVPWST